MSPSSQSAGALQVARREELVSTIVHLLLLLAFLGALLRERFAHGRRDAMAETDHQDLHQRADFAICAVSTDGCD